MTANYPNDSDGDALRRLAATGSDMSKAMDIDFQIAAPDAATAKRVADEAARLGYRISIYESPSGEWTCQCTKSMIPTHCGVIAAQAQLDAIARPLGAYADGWGTYGRSKRYTRSGSQPEPAGRRWFQYSPRSLLVAIPTLGVSIGMFCVAFSGEFSAAVRFLAGLAGLLLCGGLTGAAVGFAEDPEHGSMVRQRAIFGAILFASMLLLGAAALVLILVLTWRNFSVAG